MTIPDIIYFTTATSDPVLAENFGRTLSRVHRRRPLVFLLEARTRSNPLHLENGGAITDESIYDENHLGAYKLSKCSNCTSNYHCCPKLYLI